ncbi:MAG TPA: HAD-IA family hydrolase [Limnobacter sp.]|uniref:HAD family hydrolase n=1 Tax=Limnobacter sp. TaxID=2003368 RepID=UPI002ED7ABFD
MMITALLFDLDGTLVDTAPDLCGTIQDMQSDRGLDITPLSAMQHLASGGARALLKVGFGLEPAFAEFPTFRAEFLARYEARIARESAVYAGIRPLLDGLEAQRLRWGVVTNKPFYLAEKLLAELGLLNACEVLVGGDTAAAAKPSPAPCLLAASRMNLPPSACAMIGDDERDIVAGREAGMFTVAAGYGYIASTIEAWKADVLVHSTQELQRWVNELQRSID